MRNWIFWSWLFFAIPSFAQVAPKTRTRTIDYTRYDKLTSNLAYAANKPAAIQELLSFSDQNFTSGDEEYFNVRILAATYESTVYDNRRAIEYVQDAIEAFERNFPFVTRGYATVRRENLLQAYLSLARYDLALNLFDKAALYLESKKNILDTSSAFTVRQQYYSLRAQAQLGDEQYDSAIATALTLRKLTEAGTFAIPAQNPDVIYKIDSSYSKEVRETLRKAKEQYIKSMRDGQEAILSAQRLDYNRILSEANYKQYQYASAVPYLRAMADEMIRMMDYSKKAMAMSQEQLKNTQLADSIRKQMKDASTYIDQIMELGVSSAWLVISAAKAGQPELAAKYAYGKIEKALLYQMTGQQAHAEQYYQTSFSLMKKMSSVRWSASAGDQFYKAYRPFYVNLLVQEKNLDKAWSETVAALEQDEESLKKNFQFFTESERKEFFKAYNLKLEKYYSLLLLMTENKTNRAGELLNKILQTKGIILDLTRAQERQLKKITDKNTVRQIGILRKMRDKLATMYQLNQKSPNPSISDSIAAISVRVNLLERKINEKLGTAADLMKPVDWRSVQAKLKNDEVYIEILRLRRDDFSFGKPGTQYWALIIKKGIQEPDLLRLRDGDSMENRDLKNYQNRIRGELDDNDSYKTFWADLAQQTQGTGRVILSEDGVYHMINPLTLTNPATGKFLLEEISLTRVSTGRDFLNIPDPPPATRQISLVGNPAFSMSRKGNINLYQGNEFDRMDTNPSLARDNMAMLPGTEQEVESIGSMAAGAGIKSDVLSGPEATEAHVKAIHDQQVLHLATHGAFDKDSKADSYLRARLILAGAADPEPFTIKDYGTYEDGFLTAYEVTQLDLSKTNLVVLSACETGTGEWQSGEGVWGLQRAFQLAGARTVMGSLWKISDSATVTFMTAFYKEYLRSSDVGAAYKQAMLQTLKQYPRPYYWGAFTLTGAQ